MNNFIQENINKNTSGVSFNDSFLNNKKNNFLSSVFFEDNIIGISFLDVNTGEFFVSLCSLNYQKDY